MEDNFNFDEPFEVRINEDNDPNRPHFYIYNGLMESTLFNGYEKLMLIYMIGFSQNSDPNHISTITISINKLSAKTQISKATLCKYIKLLEEKGVIIKEGRISEDNGYLSNNYKIFNYLSVWDCKTLEELKKETNRIKREIQNGR